MKKILYLFLLAGLVGGSAEARPVLDENGPLVPARGVQIAESDTVRAERQTGNYTVIPLNQWIISAPAVPPYAQIRTSFENGEIVIRPNENEPSNSFGWIEAPTINVFGGGGSDGDSLVMRVRYTRSPNFTGTAPTLRLRAHNGDFSLNATTGSSDSVILNDGGSGEFKLLFDRNQLASGANTVRLFIDLLSVYESQFTVDPNFEFRITEVAWKSLDAQNVNNSTSFIAVYREGDGDLYAHVPGADRTRLRENIDEYAWDSSYAIAIDNENLYAWRSSNTGDRIRVDQDGNVLDAAIAGPYVGYLNSSGEVHIYNIDNGNRRQVVDSGANGVGAAGDRRTIVILDGSGLGGFDLFTIDAANTSSSLVTQVDDNDVEDLRSRMTDHY